MSKNIDWLKECRYPEANILIVDDAEDFTNLLNAILRKVGYRNINIVNDPKEASEAFNKVRPDVMMLDFQMPDLSGLDVLKNISETSKAGFLPIIMLTASDELDTRLACLEAGAQDFISKSFDRLDLLVKINTIIQLSLLYKALKDENITLGDTLKHKETALSTERRSRLHAEKQLQHSLYHDRLTGLPNKALFSERLIQDINYSKRNETQLGILVVVIDNLRDINYTLGHQHGDSVIRILADHLTAVLRKIDTVTYIQQEENSHLSRITGNSFAIITPSLKDEKNCNIIAERIIELLQETITINQISINLLSYIGIVYYPEHGEDVNTLMQRADIAAYQAQMQKKNICIYSPENDEFTTTKLALAQDLKQAIKNDQLQLFMQPKSDLSNHQIKGFEVLLRWSHPEQGFIPPDQIVELAENTGLITSLTQWVIKTSIIMGKKLVDSGYDLSLSINITASDLLNVDVMDHLLDSLKQFNFPAELIILEITEGSMVHNPSKAMDMIMHYSDSGLKMSIDDFGTGYSCLSYLQKLKVNELKIDRSFVMDMDTNPDNQMIVQSIIDIAHHLNLSVVAEGIENQAIYDLLTQYGCDIAQGYYLAKPMPYDDAIEFLDDFDKKQQPAK